MLGLNLEEGYGQHIGATETPKNSYSVKTVNNMTVNLTCSREFLKDIWEQLQMAFSAGIRFLKWKISLKIIKGLNGFLTHVL